MTKLKPARVVYLDDIISNQIIGDDPELIALVMRVHLALEALLIETIHTFGSGDRVYNLNFSQKTESLFSKQLITAGAKWSFDAFNMFRNRFVHVFGHKVTLSDSFSLSRDFEQHGIDFTD